MANNDKIVICETNLSYFNAMILNRGLRLTQGGRQLISRGARALMCPTTWKVWSMNWSINTFVFTAYSKLGVLKQNTII